MKHLTLLALFAFLCGQARAAGKPNIVIVLVDDMKLVRAGRNGAWELYDLAKDRTEQHDLAAAQPDKAQELAAKWEAWAERAQVKPYPVNKQKQAGEKNAAASPPK